MSNQHRFAIALGCAACVLAGASGGIRNAMASDHGDIPSVAGVLRHDANISDLFAFTTGRDRLVIAIGTNPAIPRSAAGYAFPTDVAFDIFVDTDSPVDPADPSGLGGTILDPGGIAEDVVYSIRFAPTGEMRLTERRRNGPRWVTVPITQARPGTPGAVLRFAGLRDDPFIRGPRIGRNVGAIVLEIPLHRLGPIRAPLLIWATARVDEFDGTGQDLVGRSLRSMMPTNQALNLLHPSKHLAVAGLAPDVMIYDLSRPVGFPNGRRLEDDVIDLVGIPALIANDAPWPDANDRPFLTEFPYLAPPHPPIP